MYIITDVMENNVAVFSTGTYFWKACEPNSSGVILKCLAMHDQSLQNTSRPNVLIYLINSISGIISLNDCYKEKYYYYVEDRAMPVCILEAHTIGYPE